MQRRDEAESADARSPGSPLRWLATRRVPAWLALLLVLAVAVPLGWLLVGERRDDVELGPALTGATRVGIELQICNRVVDANGINPRQAELDLQSMLEDEGAESAVVRIRRQDCPTARNVP